VCQCVSVSVCQCVSVSVCQCVSVSVCQSVSLSVRQSVSPSVRQSVSPSVRQSVSPSVRQSVSRSVGRFNDRTSAGQSTSLPRLCWSTWLGRLSAGEIWSAQCKNVQNDSNLRKLKNLLYLGRQWQGGAGGGMKRRKARRCGRGHEKEEGKDGEFKITTRRTYIPATSLFCGVSNLEVTSTNPVCESILQGVRSTNTSETSVRV